MAALLSTAFFFLTLFLIENRFHYSTVVGLRALAHGSLFLINVSFLSFAVPFLFPNILFSQETVFSQLPGVFQFGFILITLDLCAYFLHWLSHHTYLLWSFHQVHHSDDEVDSSTALRIHTFQMALGLIPDLVLLSLLSPTREAYLAYVLFAQMMVLFHHSKISLPSYLEKSLSTLFVMPKQHRLHHLRVARKQLENYGSVLSVWDKVFRTQMQISKIREYGLPEVRMPFTLTELLLPQRRQA